MTEYKIYFPVFILKMFIKLIIYNNIIVVLPINLKIVRLYPFFMKMRQQRYDPLYSLICL